MDDFSERFALVCRLRGLTCTSLAAKVGVDEGMTSRWLRGKARPRKTAEVVELALEMSLPELYSLDVDQLRRDCAALDTGMSGAEVSA